MSGTLEAGLVSPGALDAAAAGASNADLLGFGGAAVVTFGEGVPATAAVVVGGIAAGLAGVGVGAGLSDWGARFVCGVTSVAGSAAGAGTDATGFAAEFAPNGSQ